MKNQKVDYQTTAPDMETSAEPRAEGAESASDATMTPAADDTDDNPSCVAGELARLNARIEEGRDKYLRLQAEFDNYRKRTLREKMELVASGGEEVIKALLPVVDDVDRAVDAMLKSDDIEALRRGIELIAQKFCAVLRSRGLEEIDALGKPFDVDLEEAVARVPVEEQARKGTVVDVVEKGYRLADKVVRYAKVVVGA